MASERLSAIEVHNIKPGNKPRKLRDGNGLNLLAHPNGSKYFQLRYILHGKKKCFSLASTHSDGTSCCQGAARAARERVTAGVDPVQNKRIQDAKKAISATNTFRHVADQWLNIKQVAWHHPPIGPGILISKPIRMRIEWWKKRMRNASDNGLGEYARVTFKWVACSVPARFCQA